MVYRQRDHAQCVFDPPSKAVCAHLGVQITTPEIYLSKAQVEIRTDVRGGLNAGTLRVETVLLSPDGLEVARGSASLPAKDEMTAVQVLSVAAPRLWDIDCPQLYH